MVTGEVLWVELTAAGAWWDNSFLNKIIAHIHQNILTLSPFFSHRFLQFQGNQNVLVRLVLIQPLSGWQQQRCCVRERVRYNINIHQTDTTYQLHFVALTIFSSPTALTAISGRSKSVGRCGRLELLLGWQQQRCHLTELVDSNGDDCEGDGWWPELDGCSDGAGAADDGLRWGWKEADVFSVEIDGGEEIWPTWWSSGHFCHGEMKITLFARKEGRERENDLNLYLRKIWRHRWIQIVCNEKMWDYQQ